jgi:hypothetical protein
VTFPGSRRIVGDIGDCEQRALEVKGTPDQETRVAAEWWYLYYTLRHDWTGIHATTRGDGEGVRFSVHDIHIFPDTSRQVYFRVFW